MKDGTTAETDHLDAVSAVTQLILRERQTRDRGWYDQMAECYAPDSIVDMSWFTGSGPDFVSRSQFMSTSQHGWGGSSGHRLSPPTVRLNGDRAWAELPLAIEFRIMVNGVEADLTSHCRNQYRVRHDSDGQWRIVRLTSIYESDTLTAAVPGTDLALGPRDFAGLRPSYRCLAWYQKRLGIELRADLLGDDLPDPVAAQYAAEADWLAQSSSNNSIVADVERPNKERMIMHTINKETHK